jgi:uncharacterized coiled-coil DUF342 family protein
VSRRVDPPQRHVFIGGTGRAGTSFLVGYLAEMGLETHVAVHDTPFWDDEANAGFEDHWKIMKEDGGRSPYLLKSPWLFEYIDDVLADSAVRLDAVIIPMRDLTEAATSRVVLELQSIHRKAPWMAELSRSWETWAYTPGGVVYSLNPIDQGRLLAVGFHHLVQRLVKADIPLLLLDFPRLAEDADYLLAKLRPLLPAAVTAEQGRAVHAKIADATKIRIGREMQAEEARRPPQPDVTYGDYNTLDRIALGREIARLNKLAAQAEAQRECAATESASLRNQLSEAGAESESLRNQLSEAAAEAAGLRNQLSEASAKVAGLRNQLSEAVAEAAGLRNQLSETTAEAAGLRDQLSEAAAEAAGLRNQLSEASDEISGVQRQLADRSDQLAEARGQLAQLSIQFATAREQISHRSAEAASLQAQLVECQAERMVMLNSRRWRMTQPIADMVRVMRALKLWPAGKVRR